MQCQLFRGNQCDSHCDCRNRLSLWWMEWSVHRYGDDLHGCHDCSRSRDSDINQSGTFQSLNHIILFAQENRSLDHYFGYMRAYWAANGITDQAFDGLAQFNPASGIPPLQGPAPTNPGCDPSNPDGPKICVPDDNNPVTSFHLQSICTEELSPFWNESHVDWNDNFEYPNKIDPKLNG